jgi:hypothetical protein
VRYIPIELDDDAVAELIDPSIEAGDLDFAVVHVSPQVRSYAAQNPSLSAQQIQWLLRDQPQVQAGLARNPAIDAQTLITLSQSPHIRVRSQAISHSSFPAASLAPCAKDSSSRIRAAVAQSPHADAPTLSALATDSEFEVRACVARHASTPSEVLGALADDSFDEVITAVAENPHTPLTVLEKFLSGTHLQKLHVAKNPALTDEILKKALTQAMELTEDQDETWEEMRGDTSLRGWIAERTPLSAELISILSQDPYQWVRAAVAKNPSVPDSVLAQLALDPEESVRSSVVDNPSASADTKATAALLGIEEN